MDPITVVGFVAAVVQLIDVTSKVVKYFNEVKDAPKDRAKLAREATGLLALFTDLRYRVEESSSTDPWFTGLRSLGRDGGPLMEFRIAMEDIADKLAPTRGFRKFRRDLLWTLDKKEIDSIISKIERLKTLVGLALQKDNFKLSLAMKEEVTLGFQDMKTQIAEGFQETETNRDVENINKWLGAPDPSSNHNTAMKKKQSSTGEWFTKSKEFEEWKMEPSSIIWLHGIPGCGKTILCSTIIRDVVTQYQSDSTVVIAYFYFDFNDVDKQRTEKLIRSLIVQMAAQCPHLPGSLQSAYSRSQNGQNQPTIEEMTAILRQMLGIFNTTYILLDALDECTDREDLLEFIEVLIGWKTDSLHVLTTSRKENDITTSLEPLVTCQLCIQSALVDADIRVHVLERLSKDPKLKKWSLDVQKEIEDALMTGANGMFRWVVCQLDSLRKCLKLDALRKALNTLPKTLDDTYERILSNLDEDYKEDALKVFQWLCFSARPMRVVEIVDVLAVDSTCFRPEQKFPDPRDILTICSTLVSATAAIEENSSKKTQELRLAHFSVKEYLISDRLKNGLMHRYHITSLSANVSIAKTCLTYLLHFESPTILTDKLGHEFPFIRYAAEFWPRHYGHIPDDANRKTIDFLICNLVDSKKSCFINWLKVYDRDGFDDPPDLYLNSSEISTPLYYMSYLGISGVFNLLLTKDVDVNAEGEFHGNPLSAASANGHKELVRLLLERGANVNAEGGYYDNALSAALWTDHGEVALLLLENGANINAGGGYGSALTAVSSSGHERWVRLLLENGANVNAVGGIHSNALLEASSHGHEGVVRMLLEKGAHVNAEGGRWGNALLAASSHGHEGVVQLLLEKGANFNAEGDYGNALTVASSSGHEWLVRLLLEKGANVNAQGGYFGNALSAASCCGHEGVVRLLLEKGANVNAEGGDYGNALSAASSSGRKGVVRLLLEKGANVNAKGGYYGNALSMASLRGLKKVVQLLLEKGANVNAEGGHYGNALSAASRSGHEGVVQLLLEKGANINAGVGGKLGIALSAASSRGHEGVVRLLLENGADINLVFDDDGEALRGISVDDHEAVIQLLLKKLYNPRLIFG